MARIVRRSLVGGALLASAFSPLLAVMVLIVQPSDELWLTVVFVALALTPIPLLLLVLRALGRVQRTRVHTREVRSRDQDVIGFVSAYVLPLAAVILAGDGSYGDAATLLLLGFLALVYIRGGLYHLNPTFTLLGYRLYEVVQVNGAAVMVLTRAHHLPQEGELDARRLADGVLIQLDVSEP